MSFNGLLNQTISVKNPTGAKDLHGKKTLSSAVEYACRFERTYKTIVTAERDREPIHALVAVGPDANVVKGAQVTFGGEVFRVMQRADAPGRNGQIHHYELMLQEWEFGS